MTLGHIGRELRSHAPFTAAGTATGIIIMAGLSTADAPQATSQVLFWACHPLHVLLSALVTASMYRLHGSRRFLPTVLVGYVGAIGIATLSDSLIPHLGEWMLQLPNRGIHLGFIEKWWLVNPFAVAGGIVAWYWPRTRFPHAGHVLLSTWASLFHMTMALSGKPEVLEVVLIAVFLFCAVWIPCCTSDIVFPLLFAEGGGAGQGAERSPLATGIRRIGHVRQLDGNRSEIVIDPGLGNGLLGVTAGDRLQILYWMHELADKEREALSVHPRGDRSRPRKGVFGLRSPMRPNPIGISMVRVERIAGTRLKVTGLDARDGSPVIDIKCEPSPGTDRPRDNPPAARQRTVR